MKRLAHLRDLHRRLVGLLLVPLLGGGLALAQEEAGAWRSTLQSIERQLLEQDYESAERLSQDLAQEFADQIVAGQGTEALMAMVTTYRALAVAGQGRGDEAIWHWQVAQQLFPQVAAADLSRFGGLGGFLRMHAPREINANRADAGTGESRGDFEPPTRKESPQPDFPDGRALRGLQVDVVVQVVIDVDGRPGEPVILQAEGEPTLVWAALEALRQWRFEPARRDGEPEPALYTLTVSFRVPED